MQVDGRPLSSDLLFRLFSILILTVTLLDKGPLPVSVGWEIRGYRPFSPQFTARHQRWPAFLNERLCLGWRVAAALLSLCGLTSILVALLALKVIFDYLILISLIIMLLVIMLVT